MTSGKSRSNFRQSLNLMAEQSVRLFIVMETTTTKVEHQIDEVNETDYNQNQHIWCGQTENFSTKTLSPLHVEEESQKKEKQLIYLLTF